MIGIPLPSFLVISTHTLTWSVTNPPTLETKGYKNFNSHAHVERDENRLSTPFDVNISTHTLTWSVTGDRYTIAVILGDFNSHAHVERDTLALSDVTCSANFNSHAHVERDRQLLFG